MMPPKLNRNTKTTMNRMQFRLCNSKKETFFFFFRGIKSFIDQHPKYTPGRKTVWKTNSDRINKTRGQKYKPKPTIRLQPQNIKRSGKTARPKGHTSTKNSGRVTEQIHRINNLPAYPIHTQNPTL
jgi:hypothetical protein